MATLWRVLKYAPTVAMGLLVAVWVTSLWETMSVSRSTASGWHVTHAFPQHSFFWSIRGPKSPYVGDFPYRDCGLLGYFDVHWAGEGNTYAFWIQLPFAAVATALLLPSIGPLISFRFCVWHYFAYVTLVAIELAYYLQWQE